MIEESPKLEKTMLTQDIVGKSDSRVVPRLDNDVFVQSLTIFFGKIIERNFLIKINELISVSDGTGGSGTLESEITIGHKSFMALFHYDVVGQSRDTLYIRLDQLIDKSDSQPLDYFNMNKKWLAYGPLAHSTLRGMDRSKELDLDNELRFDDLFNLTAEGERLLEWAKKNNKLPKF